MSVSEVETPLQFVRRESMRPSSKGGDEWLNGYMFAMLKAGDYIERFGSPAATAALPSYEGTREALGEARSGETMEIGPIRRTTARASKEASPITSPASGG
jgi:hypothetical protein